MLSLELRLLHILVEMFDWILVQRLRNVSLLCWTKQRRKLLLLHRLFWEQNLRHKCNTIYLHIQIRFLQRLRLPMFPLLNRTLMYKTKSWNLLHIRIRKRRPQLKLQQKLKNPSNQKERRRRINISINIKPLFFFFSFFLQKHCNNRHLLEDCNM